MDLRFGLAAWGNRHAEHILYPLGTPHRDRLPRYSGLFPVVEADVLHHQKPEPGTLEAWIGQTPAGFRFLPKLHKTATHGHRDDAALDAAREALRDVEALRDAGRLGPTLAQFPRSFRPTDEAVGWLDALLALAPAEGMAVEFRHRDWFTEETRDTLRRHRAALCWSTYDAAPAPAWATADFGYLRFVGTVGKRRGRWVTRRDRLGDILDVRARLSEAPWDEAFVIVTNRFEGNAVDSMPRIAAALGDAELARRCTRRPAQPLFPDPARWAGSEGENTGHQGRKG